MEKTKQNRNKKQKKKNQIPGGKGRIPWYSNCRTLQARSDPSKFMN